MSGGVTQDGTMLINGTKSVVTQKYIHSAELALTDQHLLEHPLLRGQVLIWRRDHNCSKCENKSPQCQLTSVVFFWPYLKQPDYSSSHLEMLMLILKAANGQITYSQGFDLHCFQCALSPRQLEVSRRQIHPLTVQSFVLYEDFFKCHHDDKQCCESRGDQAGCCFCVFGHLNGTDRRAHKHTAITLTHSHSLALYPFQSHTLLIVSFPSRSLTTHHTAITGAGWISIVMCLVASHWL